MATLPVSAPVPMSRVRSRSVLVASADTSFRSRVRDTLSGLRWQVAVAETGAQAWAEAERTIPEALLIDGWLPDLDAHEFLRDFRASFPQVDIVTTEPSGVDEGPRSPYRQEILYALRSSEESIPSDTAAWNTAYDAPFSASHELRKPPASVRVLSPREKGQSDAVSASRGIHQELHSGPTPVYERLPELIGSAGCMLEVSRRVRLVAARNTPVLIQGPTGSGKEIVAEALHRMSSRSRKPFLVINCAAIPEALLEAELFGHTRGAFTGAVQGRVGRIEAADGGTLFLDEIGEMPLALQAKLLRFVECGELQRVGENEAVKVDVRILAATHRNLAARAKEGTFRADLFYRLAVFLIRTPSLAEHMEDLPLLMNHFLEQMGRTEPMKRLDANAMSCLERHAWPGNVRELEHVLERAMILAGQSDVITANEIEFGLEAE